MRFAKPHKYEATEEPRHILFDIASEALDATGLDGTTPTVNVDKLCGSSKRVNFHGEIDDKPFEARIAINPETQRFEVESERLDKVFIRDPVHKVFARSLERIARAFAFSWEHRAFTPRGSSSRRTSCRGRVRGNRLNIHKIVVGCAGLEGIKSEKGDIIGWSKDAVFGAIRDKSQVFASAKWTPEILVCDERGQPAKSRTSLAFAKQRGAS